LFALQSGVAAARRLGRYVGSVRAINLELLDSYLLKSLDGFANGPVASSFRLVKCLEGKICAFLEHSEHETGSTTEVVDPNTGEPMHFRMVKPTTVSLGR
jgi:hypothetical protein